MALKRIAKEVIDFEKNSMSGWVLAGPIDDDMFYYQATYCPENGLYSGGNFLF